MNVDSASHNNSNVVTILSYNINLLPRFSLSTVTSSGHGYAYERMKEFQTQIASYDIILLQEVFSTPHLPFLCWQRDFINAAKSIGFHHVVRGQQVIIKFQVYF